MPWPVATARAGAALALALTLGVSAGRAEGAAEPRTSPAGADGTPAPRAVIAFLPASSGPPAPLLVRLGWRRELAVGLASPTLGGYSGTQLALDLSQGARIPRRAYPRELDPLRLERVGAGGRIAGFAAARSRAAEAPGEIVPGLLADTVARAGGRVSYVGATAFAAPDAEEPVEAVEGVVASDRGGAVERVSLGSRETFPRRARAAARASTLVVARLPAGDAGLRALDALLVARGAHELLVVLRAPPSGALRLLPVGVAAPGLGGGTLHSAATRQPGLVAAPDLTATVLEHLRLAAPDAVEGRVLEARAGGPEPPELLDLAARLDVVVDRRFPTVALFTLCWLGALAVAVATGRRRARSCLLRVGLLGALWSPPLALVTAALAPPRWVEVGVLALGSLALGAVTDRLVPWPRGPALPAAASVAAHALDLALGSPLIAASLVGPNPKGGGRFFGVGNELEIVLAASVLLGVGAALHGARPRGAALGLGAACVAAATVVGWGRLGADVGGVLALGAGAAVAVPVALGAPRLGLVALLLVLVPAAGLAAVLGLDLLTDGGAHLARLAADAEGPTDLLAVLDRRARVSGSGLLKTTTPLTVGIAVVVLAVGLWARRAILEPVRGEGVRAWRAAIAGTLTATIVGALANDSGPIVLLVGTAALVLSAAYLAGRPPSERRPERPLP